MNNIATYIPFLSKKVYEGVVYEAFYGVFY